MFLVHWNGWNIIFLFISFGPERLNITNTVFNTSSKRDVVVQVEIHVEGRLNWTGCIQHGILIHGWSIGDGMVDSVVVEITHRVQKCGIPVSGGDFIKKLQVVVDMEVIPVQVSFGVEWIHHGSGRRWRLSLWSTLLKDEGMVGVRVIHRSNLFQTRFPWNDWNRLVIITHRVQKSIFLHHQCMRATFLCRIAVRGGDFCTTRFLFSWNWFHVAFLFIHFNSSSCCSFLTTTPSNIGCFGSFQQSGYVHQQLLAIFRRNNT